MRPRGGLRGAPSGRAEGPGRSHRRSGYRTRIRNMDAEEAWRSKAGPWARATMPDGQQLDVIVTGRIRTPDGRWWYEAEAVLPARHTDGEGRTRPTGAPTPISVPADRITPIPGERYDTLSTSGAVAGRQWALENLHQYLDGAGRRLHRRDCWQVRAEHTLVTTAEAAGLLGTADVAVCDVCAPQRALRR
ncbi:DUF6233 domain-containing protein [Streptomyces sp. NPDC018031]|uniref:DUF6233 domain-containing protein n=1 Tax=Streptomyces sp. NPDC018031 TaxID=3365033 RepID=UPI003793601E